MTYLPELRTSLVAAAERQAHGVAAATEPRRPRRRWSLGGVAIMAGSLAALAVAVLVLVLVGHRPTPSPAPAASQYGSRSAALEGAAQVLAAFRAPNGASRVPQDPSRPRTLGWVDGGLPVPSAVDLTRFYVLRGGVGGVMAKLDPLHTLGAAFRPVDPGPFAEMYSESSVSSGSGSATTVQGATMTVPLRGVGALARRLVIETAPAGRGRVAMRVDAQAWWTVLRPAAERIPTSTRAITIERVGPIPKAAAHLRWPARLVKPGEVASTIALLNSVEVAQGTGGPMACRATGHFVLRLTFMGTGERPAPIAVVDPSCNTVALSLYGRPQPVLTLGSPTGETDPLRGIRLIELLTGAPQTTSWQQLIGQSRRMHATGTASRSTVRSVGQP